MTKRSVNCDILRILAFFFVIAVHSLNYIDFYNEQTNGITMLFLNICRCVFMLCIPLFVVLSGYLMKKRKFNKEHIYKFGRIVITYVLCSIFCIIFISLIKNRELLSFKDYLFQILSFKAAPYSWYVNMYFGLYLMIPFLNVLWDNLKDKRQRQYLILVLIIIGVLPNGINIFNFDSVEWWLNPSSSDTYQMLVPDYWSRLTYIIMFYFIGCYFRDYKLKLSLKKNIVALFIAIVVSGLFNYYRSYNSLFGAGGYADYNSIELLIITILFVNLILNLKVNMKSRYVSLISKISYLTFGAYLVSAIFDRLFYPMFFDDTMTVLNRLPYLILIIPLIVICSLILSAFIELLIFVGKKGWKCLSGNIFKLIKE